MPSVSQLAGKMQCFDTAVVDGYELKCHKCWLTVMSGWLAVPGQYVQMVQSCHGRCCQASLNYPSVKRNVLELDQSVDFWNLILVMLFPLYVWAVMAVAVSCGS